VNDKRAMFKVRFDDFPTAQFDYSFNYKSSAWSYIAASPKIDDNQCTNTNEPLATISRKFKSLIKVTHTAKHRSFLTFESFQFMLPPDWELTREQISEMTDDELSRFDVDIFMQSYREKMTKVRMNASHTWLRRQCPVYHRLLINGKRMKHVGEIPLNASKSK
jgi:hypothetical protein